jgi:hypothetical protein
MPDAPVPRPQCRCLGNVCCVACPGVRGCNNDCSGAVTCSVLQGATTVSLFSLLSTAYTGNQSASARLLPRRTKRCHRFQPSRLQRSEAEHPDRHYTCC